MIDLHRRDALARFLPAIAGEPDPFRDAYLHRLAVLSGVRELELVRALQRTTPRDDPEALRVLGLLLPVRP